MGCKYIATDFQYQIELLSSGSSYKDTDQRLFSVSTSGGEKAGKKNLFSVETAWSNRLQIIETPPKDLNS